MANPPKPHTSPDWTIRRLLVWATEYFNSHDIDSPRSTAEILISHALKLRRIDLYTQFDKPLTPRELSGVKTLIKRRLAREPVAYITGVKGFWNLELAVDPAVLIPRPETEHLVEAALDIIDGWRAGQGAMGVLELGVGSGAVILSLAGERPGPVYFASDLSPEALALARKNARHHPGGSRVHFFSGDWTRPLAAHGSGFGLILSNPPYIARDEIDKLQPEIRAYEPMLALDGAPDGLGCLRQIIGQAHPHLTPGGHLLCEIGYDQAAAVEEMARACGAYEAVRIFKDHAGCNRVVQMRKKV